MFGININVDPKNMSDMQQALEFILNQPCMSRFKESFMNRPSNPVGTQSSSVELQHLNDKIHKLVKEIEMHQKENEKNQELLSDKDADIAKLNHNMQEQVKKINEEYKKISENNENLKSELLKSLKENEKKEEDAKRDLQTLEIGYKKKLDDKDKEIYRLRKMLESYSVSFGSDDPSEKNYFEVSENGSLEESMISSDSLYCASRSGDTYKFTINTEDGPIIKAISDINKYLAPFCEIQNQMEGANTIQIVSIGKAKLMGTLQVIEKAVISLIKQ